MNTEQKKKRKFRNKKIFLNDLKGAINEIKEADKYAIENSLQYPVAFDIVKKNGGINYRADSPKKRNVANNHSVKLTDTDYQKIIKKYGTFAKGVRTLLQD